jgi:hypothetical protein
MTRFVTRALVVVAATLGIVFAQIAPASATVHEIVGQWCSRGASGKGELAPPGISDPTKRNFAQPLVASGVVEEEPVQFDPPGDQPAGFLVKFNYDNPNVKVVPTGVFVVIGQVAGSPLYLELIEPNPDFVAFTHCPNLVITD